MSSNEQKIKVVNPNKFNVGLTLMDDKPVLVKKDNGFYFLDKHDIEYIENISKIFRNSHLIIENDELNERFGYTQKSIASYSEQEIKSLIGGNITKIKKELEAVTEKHLVDKVIEVAKTIDDLAKNKITFLQEWSGYDLDQLVDDKDKT